MAARSPSWSPPSGLQTHIAKIVNKVNSFECDQFEIRSRESDLTRDYPVTDHAQLIGKTARLFSHDLTEELYHAYSDGVAAEIYPIYTMEREREIHRALFPPIILEDGADTASGSVEVTPALAANDDSLDDIFF